MEEVAGLDECAVQQLKDSDDDERVLTVAIVIGKVEPSAKKAAAWTDEEFKSVVEAHAQRGNSVCDQLEG